MPYEACYSTLAPERNEVDELSGPTVLEFGVDWCPHCQAVQGALRAALAATADIRHIKVEDGPGRRLGRSYRVKLWPTLVFLLDGREVDRIVRPTDLAEIETALRKIAV